VLRKKCQPPTLPTQLSVYVKRRPGHVSYPTDTCAYREFLLETQHETNESHRRHAMIFRNLHADPGVGTCNDLASSTDDAHMLNFARYFCDDIDSNDSMTARSFIWGGGVSGGPLGGVSSSMGQWCSRILYECVTQDKPAALILYLQLHHTALYIGWVHSCVQDWSVHATLEHFMCCSHGACSVFGDFACNVGNIAPP